MPFPIPPLTPPMLSHTEIYCVVMGARSALFKNQLACIMRFVAGPNGKVQLAKDGSIAVDCCVIEFHHDRKNRAAKFHKACEQMMKALLFAEMSKIDEIDAAAKEETKGDEGGEIVGGYMVSLRPFQRVPRRARG